MKIKKALVLGAGTMGSQIAAHLANIGIKTYLLDIVPKEGEDKNKLSKQGLERAKKIFPPAFYDIDFADDIEVGNFEDDLKLVNDVDWVIEAVIENIEIKRKLFENVEKYWKKGTIVTTNTSGLPVNEICEGRNEDFKKHFFGTHFFNPPRYMKLLEIIPSKDTSREIIQNFIKFAERELGKGVVIAKDTPNFIANRIGVFTIMYILKLMQEMELSPEEIDALTGRVMGRPRTATFRTLDMVGLDILYHVAKNLYERAKHDEMREFFKPPEFLEKMVNSGILGDKSGGGFYKKEKKNGETKRFTFDINKMEYREYRKSSFPSLERAMQEEKVKDRIKYLIQGKDKGAEFAWKSLSETLLYCARRIPEISDDIISIDNAMKWGFNWDMGPFEIWDSIGVKESVKRMEEEGKNIPEWIREFLDSGKESFYRKEKSKKFYFYYPEKDYKLLYVSPYYISLIDLKEEGKVIKENPESSLIDLGDGVVCLEFHTRANVIGPGIAEMTFEAIDYVEKEDLNGLVIGNQGRHFSAGANLAMILMIIQEEEWDELEMLVKEFQRMTTAIKYFSKPIVTAPFGRVLGGGCEICLHSAHIQASAELYMGLVEIAVGLLPAGGGTKEMLLRHMDLIPPDTEVDFYPYLRRIIEIIGMAKVSMSAYEAKKLGFLRESDGITINQDHLIHDAKEKVLHLAKMGYKPPRKRKIKMTGRDGMAYLEMLIFNLKDGNRITEHESLIAKQIAKVLTGGDIPAGTYLDEQELLDLEREAFLYLCGTQKTRERIEHMLLKGKPLRN